VINDNQWHIYSNFPHFQILGVLSWISQKVSKFTVIFSGLDHGRVCPQHPNFKILPQVNSFAINGINLDCPLIEIESQLLTEISLFSFYNLMRNLFLTTIMKNLFKVQGHTIAPIINPVLQNVHAKWSGSWQKTFLNILLSLQEISKMSFKLVQREVL